MRLSHGSLQKKRKTWYWVTTVNGRQKWVALKTENVGIARLRAQKFAADIQSEKNSEKAWLEQLVRLGDDARVRLARLRTCDDLRQHDLWSVFLAHTPKAIPAASRETYRHWLALLSSDSRAQSPASLTADDARQIASDLSARYLSAGRMIAFFRRVWRVLGLDASVWNVAVIAKDSNDGAKTDRADTHEHYRRLTCDEVSRLLAYLATSSISDAPAYSDMIMIGYYTGLRLSDVAELNRDEVMPDAQFLSLLPNKTRHHRRIPLRIPLVGLAHLRVQKRLATANADGYLFPLRIRRRPSHALGRIFRASKVLKHGNGRASFHSLRATFISLMDEAGVPPHITDAITGHADGGMHARYTQPSDAALVDAVRRAIPTPILKGV